MQELEPIRRAILDAHAADVLVFAAASNGGGNQSVTFPASMDEVICVGSTDGYGGRSSFTPSLRHGKRLCTVGEGIESSWPQELCPNGRISVRKSGTSYATPVASGVAAMVLDYMWAVKDQLKDRYLVQKLRTKRGMLAVFEHMIDRDGRSYDYLVPWRLFSPVMNGDMDIDDDDLRSGSRQPEQQGSGSGTQGDIVTKIIGTLRLI